MAAHTAGAGAIREPVSVLRLLQGADMSSDTGAYLRTYGIHAVGYVLRLLREADVEEPSWPRDT